MAAKIIIVEDEVLVAMALQDQLQALGHDVAIFMDEEGGMAAVEGSLDLAILDFHLAGRSPLRLIEVLRAKGVPIIICSGSSIGGGSRIPADLPFIAKPYSEAEMEAAVQSALKASEPGVR